MIEPEFDLTKEDFASHPWQQALSGVEHKSCFAYSCRLSALASNESDSTKKAIWMFLARATSLHLNIDSPGEPYGTFLEQLHPAEIELMRVLAPEIDDPILQARLADIVWTRQPRGNHVLAEKAVKAYLESARRVEHPREWVECAESTERALQLAVKLNNQGLIATVVEYIENVLGRCNGEDPLYLSLRMMELLLEQHAGQPEQYAPLAEKLAQRAEDAADFDKAKRHWEIKARWHRLAKDETNVRAALLAAAETHVKEADRRVQQPNPSYMHAAGQIERAIIALRKVADTQERVRQLHETLIDYQAKSVAEYAHFASDPIDMTDVVEQSRQRVRDKSLFDALFALALAVEPCKVEQIREQTKEMAQNFVMLSLFPSTRTNALGRTVGRQPSLRSSSPEEAEEALRCRMHESLVYLWGLKSQGVIEPARQQINSEHHIRLHDFLRIVSDNPFVPAGRELLFARGLHAGMAGDFMTAVHFLVPQVEHSIRYLLYQNGLVASSLDDDGIQDEFNLNRTLTESRCTAILKRILGENMLFELRAILIERHGANLRNEMAHGLLDSDAFFTSVSCFFWGLVLRLCCLPIITRLKQAQAKQEEDTPS